MCFGSKSKQLYDDDAPRPAAGQFPQQPTYADPAPKASMPQQQYQNYQQQTPAPMSPPPPQQQEAYYQPPSGPPPLQQQFQTDNTSQGPPPAELSSVTHSSPPAELGNDFAPPPGPPPSHQQRSQDNDLSYIKPPPGPPPSSSEKPKHDWEIAVPDTSLFPPPPDIFSGFDRSPGTNATEAEAEAGERWCAQFPLTAPLNLDAAATSALRAGAINLMQPATNFLGDLIRTSEGSWSATTSKKATDSCIIGYPPLYSVTEHSPLGVGRGPKTIYYEVAIKHVGSPKEPVCLALGYTALPYPSFRMPGWHRGSLAVHGDDGHKFINDRWGGKSFTEPFRRGETYGIGMTFRPSQRGLDVDVFFTRGGRWIGGWNLHEESDAEQDLPVTGLEGYHDLSCAIGIYQAEGIEIVFDPARWLYKPVV